MTHRSLALGVTAFLGAAAILGGSLAGLLGLGVQHVAGGLLPEPPAECPTHVVAPAPLAGLAVKVHNSAKVEGLAASTAQVLKKQGVKVASLGNKAAPEASGEGHDVIIAASAKHLPEAVALQSLFPASVFLLDDAEPEPSIYLTRADPKTNPAPAASRSAVRCAAG
ncbi:LytR C-terminal domain-containing protein [Arthrobacter sp. HLT1-20]